MTAYVPLAHEPAYRIVYGKIQDLRITDLLVALTISAAHQRDYGVWRGSGIGRSYRIVVGLDSGG